MSRSVSARSTPTDYAALVRRIRTLVEGSLPKQASVLVVGKGDHEIARLGTRRTSPFPQDESGGYAGHYPADAGSAIHQIESLRAAGAQYILFPRTAYWWLDHYQGLRAHLDTRARRVELPSDECRIWSLAPVVGAETEAAVGLNGRAAGSATTAGHGPGAHRLDVRIEALLDALLDRGVRIAHLREPGDPELHSVEHSIESVDAPTPTYPEMPESLMALRDRGIDVVLLAGARSDLGWSDNDAPSLRAAIERWLPRIAHREHLCTLYDLENGGRLHMLPAGSKKNGNRHA